VILSGLQHSSKLNSLLSQEKKAGMLGVAFAAFGFAPLSTVMSPDELKSFVEKFDQTFPTSTGALKKEKELLRQWTFSQQHAHIE
jgi:hypothetical protein